MSDVKDSHTTVPFTYGAVLEWEERLSRPDGAKVVIQPHRMTVRGQVHPEPYNLDAASELVDRKLRPLVDLGWRKVEIVVKAYEA